MAVACLVMTTSDSDGTLRPLVDAWSASAQAILDLAGTLDDAALAAATDLPGWAVGDVLAHLAALDSDLAGNEPVLADIDKIPPDARDNPFRAYTERGVVARRGRSREELVEELAQAVAGLRKVLAADEPALVPESFPRPGITWDALLRDRVIDYWMHEQDIRRALDRPGGWDSPGAFVTLATFRAALPFVVGKRVRPVPGSSVAVVVSGPSGTEETAVRMDDDGRARVTDSLGGEPTARLSMSVDDFVLACGGRRPVEALSVDVEGDRELGDRVLRAMSVTP